MYLPTGGTTAVPKLARLTQGGMALSGWIAGAVMGAEEDEVIGLGMPLFHVGGMLMLALRAAVLGQTVVLLSPAGFRSEEHTSELQSLMRISYAVFCLKKKKNTTRLMINRNARNTKR